jgi:oligosaccharide repeat unit polymerase
MTTGDGGSRRLVNVDVLFAPYVIALAMYVPLVALYLVWPRHSFEYSFYGHKWDSPRASAYFVLAIVCFALGSLVGDVLSRRGPDVPKRPGPRERRRMRLLCIVALVGSAAASALLFGLAVSRAGGFTALVDAYRTDPQHVKTAYFASIAGVTTLTQLAVAAVPLAFAFRLVDRRAMGALVLVVVLLVLMRSVFASERLALVELAIPLAYLLVAHRRATPVRLLVLALGLVLAVLAFFVATELRRKGPYEAFSIEDALRRFLSYYLNSINNAFAIADHDSFATPFWFSTQAVWEFPGAAHAGVTYPGTFGIDASSLFQNFYRDNSVTPSVTTFGVVGSVSADFGWAGLLWILGLGGAAGALWRASRRDPLYRALYAVWLVGVLEFLRIYYFPSTRLVPAYVVFLLAFVLVRARSRSTPEVARVPVRPVAGPSGGVAE